MNLTELKQNYVTELRNKPNINSEQTIKSYVSVINIFCSKNSRVYRLTEQDLKKYLAEIRKEYSDSYYNVIGSALKILYVDVLKIYFMCSNFFISDNPIFGNAEKVSPFIFITAYPIANIIPNKTILNESL